MTEEALYWMHRTSVRDRVGPSGTARLSVMPEECGSCGSADPPVRIAAADAGPGSLAGRRTGRVPAAPGAARSPVSRHGCAGALDRGVAVAVPVPDAGRRGSAALLAGDGAVVGRSGAPR